MTTTDFEKRLNTMVAEKHIDDLIDLSAEVSHPLQREIAKHVYQVAKASILEKTEVCDDEL